jgi:protein arginine kinase activator
MKCDLCNKPAVVHEVTISGGVKNEVHLCLEHAQAAGIAIPGQQPINKLLTKFVIGKAQGPSTGHTRCGGCGCTFGQIKQTNLIGCPECYRAFGDALTTLIEQAQFGNTEHVGRIPKRLHTPSHNEIRARKLMRELDAAVTAEQYERAAELRDRLNELTTNVETDLDENGSKDPPTT